MHIQILLNLKMMHTFRLAELVFIFSTIDLPASFSRFSSQLGPVKYLTDGLVGIAFTLPTLNCFSALHLFWT